MRYLKNSDYLVDEVLSMINKLAYQQSLDIFRIINESDSDITHDYYRLQKLTNNIINLKNSNDYIHSVYIYFNQGNVILTSFMGTTGFRNFYDTKWFEYYQKRSTEEFWINTRKPYDTLYEGKNSTLLRYYEDTKDVLTLIKPLPVSLRSKGGAIIINVYEDSISKLLNKGDNDNDIFAVDQTGTIVVSRDAKLLYTKLPESIFSNYYPDKPNNSFTLGNGDDEFLYTYLQTNNNEILFSRMRINELLRPATEIRNKIVLVALIILVLGFLLIASLYIYSTLPLRRLTKLIDPAIMSTYSGKKTEETKLGLRENLLSFVREDRGLSELIEKNRSLIKHRTLLQILSGTLQHQIDMEDRLKYMNIVFSDNYFTVLVVNLEGISRTSFANLDDEYELYKIELIRIIKSGFSPYFEGYTVDIDDMNVGAILNFDQNDIETEQQVMDVSEKIRTKINDAESINFTISIGIGNIVEGIENVPSSFNNALAAINYAKLVGSDQIISYKDIALNPVLSISKVESKQEELRSTIMMGNPEKAQTILGEIFQEFTKDGTRFESIQQYFAKTISDVSNSFMELGLSDDESFEPVSFFMGEFLNLDSVEEIFPWISSFTDKASFRISEKRVDKNQNIIDGIQSYIQANYASDISLNSVAKSVFISTPYLSKIFKEYTSKTFIEYLTEVRIEASRILLCETTENIADIGVKVGYTSTQSFIRAFKKIEGKTPTEYRAFVAKTKLLSSKEKK
ncbi:MAG: helix-turn-helix domain-containing protein [Flexilinea sp.]